MDSTYDADTNEYLGHASEELVDASMDEQPTGIVRAIYSPQSCQWEPVDRSFGAGGRRVYVAD